MAGRRGSVLWLRAVFVAGLLLVVFYDSNRVIWQAVLRGERTFITVAVDRAPIWNPPDTPSLAQLAGASGSLPAELATGLVTMEIQWEKYWLELLPAIGVVCLLGGLVYHFVRRGRIDRLLHMALPAGVGVLIVAAFTLLCWIGGAAPPYVIELGVIALLGGAAFGAWRARQLARRVPAARATDRVSGPAR